MPIDTRIPLSIRPIRFDSPFEQAQQAANLQAASQRNMLTQIMFADKARELQQDNALAGLYRDNIDAEGNVNRAGVLGGAAQKGLGAVIPKLQKGFADQDRAAADAQKSRLESGIKQLEAVGQIAGSVKDPLSLAAANQQLAAMGIPTLGDTYDPARIAQVANMALSRKDQLAQQWKALDFQLEQDKFGYQQKNDAANRAVTVRGQNMTDERGREANAISRQRLTFDQQNGGKPSAGYRWAADGKSWEPIPGGPADKTAAASEGERKAATLLKRMEGSQAQLAEALKSNPDAATPGVIANGLRAVGAEAMANSWATSPERQRVEAAQLDVLDAALTLGTGAAYTREQLEGYRRSYFPQIGDTKETIKDKEARLKNVIDAAKIAAGRAAAQGGDKSAPAGGGLTQEEMQELAELRKALGRK